MDMAHLKKIASTQGRLNGIPGGCDHYICNDDVGLMILKQLCYLSCLKIIDDLL